MQLAKPPIRGYGELARAALGQPVWPNDTQPKARSLAALFSKLDRNIELEWLQDRPDAQLAIAKTLGCSVEALRSRFSPALEQAEHHVGRVRLDDLPFARPIDLCDERLPPGIPPQVLQPGAWGRTWWHAPSGSGRTLVGQWLQARGRAELVVARTWEGALTRLSGSGPAFVELEREAEGHLEASELPATAPLCIAAPFLPPHPPAGEEPEPEWSLVASPPLEGVLQELMEWVEARLPEDGAFDGAAAEQWLRPKVQSGQLPTLGAVLGAAGLLDQVGVARASAHSLEELTSREVARRLSKAADDGSAEASWLRDHGFELIVGLAEQVLSKTEEAWERARDQDEWIALVPEEFRHGVDAQWLSWSLSRAGGRATVRDMQHALRDVPPGAFRVIRALRAAGLLRASQPPSGLTLCPEVLKHVSVALARRRLIAESSPFGWGEALLRPATERAMLLELLRQLQAGDYRPVENLLDLDVTSQPALAIATEAAFVCVGRLILCGHEIPQEALTGLWDEQMALCLDSAEGLPEPRLLGREPEGCGHPLQRTSAWRLSALAISELLEPEQGTPHARLRPWEEPPGEEDLRALLDSLQPLLCSPPGEGENEEAAWRREARALLLRLHRQCPLDPPHPLVQPQLFAESAVRGAPRWALSASLDSRAQLAATQHAAAALGTPWPRLCRALWQAWASESRAEAEGILSPLTPFCREVWRHVPPDIMADAWRRWPPAHTRWPYECFSVVHWKSFAVQWVSQELSKAPKASTWRSAFTLMEGEALRAVAEQASRDPVAPPSWLLALIWARTPEVLLKGLAEGLTGGHADRLSDVLEACPDHVTAQAVSELERGLSQRTTRPKANRAARSWLRRTIARRGRGWRAAFGLLNQIERRLANARQAERDPYEREGRKE